MSNFFFFALFFFEHDIIILKVDDLMIEFRKVSKAYKNNMILKDISFNIEKGKFTVLIGESGCGKTTLLKMINKLIVPTKGDIFIDGKDIKEIDDIKLRRSMGYVIQQTGLFPHMTVRENITIIPKILKVDENKINKDSLEMMNMIGLDESLLDRYPSELSGGQQQRIGIARAFITNPNIILMDEPFSALDPMSRVALQDELLKLQEKLHKTIVFVTHDMDEAIKLADKIAIFDNGELVQYDVPENILKHPANDFVKNFVGKKRIWTSPKYIKVEDIMIDKPVTCFPNYTVFYCLNKMKMMKVDSLMVVDDKKNFLGVLYAESVTDKEAMNKEASEYMLKDIPTVKKGDSISTLAKLVTESRLSNIPVLDEENHLCGLITRSSLIMALSQQFLEEE